MTLGHFSKSAQFQFLGAADVVSIVGISQKARKNPSEKSLTGKTKPSRRQTRIYYRGVVKSNVFQILIRRKEFEYGGGLRHHTGVGGFCLEVRNSLIIK